MKYLLLLYLLFNIIYIFSDASYPLTNLSAIMVIGFWVIIDKLEKLIDKE